LIGLVQNHPVPEDTSSVAIDNSDGASLSHTNGKESKVFLDVLRLLQDAQEGQAQLQEVLKPSPTANRLVDTHVSASSIFPQRREDTAAPAAAPATVEQSSSPAAKSLLDMGKIMKTLENVASTLNKGAKGLVADASSTDEFVLRNERDSGYGIPSPVYGPVGDGGSGGAGGGIANFITVFSQAAANTVNFGTQLLNSVVSVAANILQGTVSTLLSLLNAKGQILGAVVQSVPPVLTSVTRTAGDVLSAKAKIFGAVTQLGGAVVNSFGSFAANAAGAKANAASGVAAGVNGGGGLGGYA